jgi:radical SAM-linked protein
MNPIYYRVSIEFTKNKDMVFISHLDILRLFMRTFRKACLPLVFTQGFSPKPKLSFERALSLGVKSNKEKMAITLQDKIDLKKAKKELNSMLPNGIQIKRMNYCEKRKETRKKSNSDQSRK